MAQVNAPDLHIDFFCFGLTASDKLASDPYLLSVKRPVTPCGAVCLKHSANNTAAFEIDLQKLPKPIVRLVFAISIDGAGTMSQLVDGSADLPFSPSILARFAFTGQDFADERALMLVELYQKDGVWHFYAQGQGFNGGLAALIRYFGGTVGGPVGLSTPTVKPVPNPFAVGQRFWKPAGTKLTVANTVIEGGLVYVGSGLSRQGNALPEPALIDPLLPVADVATANYQLRANAYWSAYSEAPPEARAAYIKWLAQGRTDPTAHISYVLLYFYGLERRALMDVLTDTSAQADLPPIIEETERLLAIYGGGHGTFAHYANGLLDLLKSDAVSQSPTKPYLAPPPKFEANFTNVPMPLKLVLGQLAVDKRPLPAEWAYAWLRVEPRISLRTAATRCEAEFKPLFISQYGERFGQGITLSVNKTKIKLSYFTINPSFAQRVISKKLDLPDVTALTSCVDKLQALATHCSDQLDTYSRFIGRHPELAGTTEALLELPYLLWPAPQKQHFQPLKHRLEVAKAPIVITFSELKACLPDWQSVHKTTMKAFVKRLAEAGLGMEPDPRSVGGILPVPDSQVVLFSDDAPPPGHSSSSFSSHYDMTVMILQLVVAVASADGAASAAARALLFQQVKNWPLLHPIEINRLHAHLCWLLTWRVDFQSVQKHLKHIPGHYQVGLENLLVQVATVELPVSAAKMALLEKMYTRLKRDIQPLYGKLHVDEPVTVRTPPPRSSGFTIPKPPEANAALQLDMGRIAALKHESKQVTAMLGAIYDQGHDQWPAVVPASAKVVASHRQTLLGLDEAHHDLLTLLSARAQWTRAELAEIAAGRGMMLDGALEHINEAAYDQFDAPLLEGDDPIDINQDIFTELLK